MMKNENVKCDQLEFYLMMQENDNPFEEKLPTWVEAFFDDANKMHLEVIKKILTGKEDKEGVENNFNFWWKKFHKRLQEWRNEMELKKKAEELEDGEEDKSDSSNEIVSVNKKEKKIGDDENKVEIESQFLREMQKLAINSITKDGQEELKLVKRQIVKMTSTDTLINLEEIYPILLGIGTIEEQSALSLYKNIITETKELELALIEFRLSSALFFSRIWRKLFDKIFDDNQNKEVENIVHSNLRQLFEISKKLKIFTTNSLENLNKFDALKICLDLLQLWKEIIGDNSGLKEMNIMAVKERFEQKKALVRNELLWREHWAWLDLLKRKDKKLLDSNLSPGNIYKFSQFFGGFEQIWSNIIEMEKSGQKPLQLDKAAAADNDASTKETFMDKMLTPFRTKLDDMRISYYIEDYFEKVAFIHEGEELKVKKFYWKTTSDEKRAKWGLDLLIWLLILDENFDQITIKNDDQQLANIWWNVRVEMEIFHDSLATREGGYEGVEKPALYMLNWMYLLKHQKCIIKNENGGENPIQGEFDEEENRKEMNKNLSNYIEKCKELAKKQTDKRKYFDEDEKRKWRWIYLDKLLSRDNRFYSANLEMIFEDKIKDEKTFEKIKEVFGSQHFAELLEKLKNNTQNSERSVEKMIEIFQMPDEQNRLQALLDAIYSHAIYDLDHLKAYAQKLKINPIGFQRDFAKEAYDKTIQIEQEVENVMGIEEIEGEQQQLLDDEGEGNISSNSNIPIKLKKKNIENFADIRNRQINLMRCTKVISEFVLKIKKHTESKQHLINATVPTIQMETVDFVDKNFHQVLEYLKSYHLRFFDFKRFARSLQSKKDLQQILWEHVGAVYRLDTILGYDELEKKRNIERIWESFTPKEAAEKAKRNNGTSNSVDINTIRDINFFNDQRLLEMYSTALKKYRESLLTKRNMMAANIIIFMQYFEQFVMRAQSNSKLQTIRSKYGEQIRLFARIEFDKLLTDFDESANKLHIHSMEFFARLMREIKNIINNKFSKNDIIMEILENYRLRKSEKKKVNQKLFDDFKEAIAKLHTDAFVRLLKQENSKEKESSNKGKKDKESFAKILRDANSEEGKRQILFNLLGNFEHIASVYNEIGRRGMKIKAEDYAHFVQGKELEEETESQNEQSLRITLPEPFAEAENLGMPQIVAAEMPLEIIELTMKEIGKSDTNENSKEMEAEIVESPNDAPISFMGRLRSLYNYIPSFNKVKEEKNQNVNKQIGENGPKKGITKFFIFSGQNKPENRKHATKVEILPMKKNNEGKLEENKPKNWTIESECNGEILNQNKVKGKFIVDWEKCGLTNEFWMSSEMAVLQMFISIREPNSTSDRKYIVNFSMDLKINTEVNEEEQREKLYKLVEGRHLIEIDVTKRKKSKNETETEDKEQANSRRHSPVKDGKHSQGKDGKAFNEQLLGIAHPEPLRETENLERRKPPASKLLGQKPQVAETSKKKFKNNWADMADSDHSENDNGNESERKNVQIHEIAESGNEQHQIEEIGDNKKALKEEKKDIQITEEATSSKTSKGKKKKKVRLQTTEKIEVSSNPSSINQNDIPAVDVANNQVGDAETSSNNKSKKKREKKKKNQQNHQQKSENGGENEQGKVKILKKDEKEEKGEEMIDLPSNEINEQKFKNKEPSQFEMYFDDQFLYNKFLEIYKKFIDDGKWWSAEEHLFLTIGTYLNEIDHKLKALNEMKQSNMQMKNSIDWNFVEKCRKELLPPTEGGKLLKPKEMGKWTLEELNMLMVKLHGILTILLSQIDGFIGGNGKEVEKDENIYQLTQHLNWICLVRAICENQKFNKIWSNRIGIYNRNFIALIGQHPSIPAVGKEKKKNQLKLIYLEKLKIQFDKEYLEPYREMLNQNKLDRQLLNEYWPEDSAPKNSISVDFNKFTQQLLYSSEKYHKNDRSFKHLGEIDYNFVINDDKEEKGSLNWRHYQKIDLAIQRIKYLITKIWVPESILKIGGSYQLGTWTPTSDINAILVATKRVDKARFFGYSICESNRWCFDAGSLFCQLCQNKNIFHLVRHSNNHIPHIKFIYCTYFKKYQMDYDRSKLPKFQCAPFELMLVSLPGYGIISEKTLKNINLIEQFRETEDDKIYWQDPRAGMIHAFHGYLLNEYILSKLVNKNMLRVFRICLVTLKKWAENNHIYGGAYGFMNGASLALMLLKILLRYPIEPTVPFILAQFFLNFANWPWPLPVQFEPLDDNNKNMDEDVLHKKLTWRAATERSEKGKMFQIKVRHQQGLPTLNMPIIAPCKPERNVAYSVNHSTLEIIQRHLKFGLEAIEKIKDEQKIHRHKMIANTNANINNKYIWESWLNGNKLFSKKYTYYMVFYCFAKTSAFTREQSELGEEFCGQYVLYQLRLQLIFSVEKHPSAAGIKQCHILPNINMEKQQKKNLSELSNRKLTAVPSEFRNSLNRYWVIGLEFDDGKDLLLNSAAAIVNLEKWLNSSQYGFVEKFIQDYVTFSTRKISVAEIRQKVKNLHLYAKIVPAKQLGEWTIESQVWRPKEQKILD